MARTPRVTMVPNTSIRMNALNSLEQLTNTLSQLMLYEAQNKTKKSEAVDLSLLNVLADEFKVQKDLINQYDQTLRGAGLYESLPEDQKSDLYAGFLEDWNAGKIRDQKQLAHTIKTLTSNISNSIDSRRNMVEAYDRGVQYRNTLASEYGDIMDMGPAWEQGRLTSGYLAGEEFEGGLPYKPGTELEALFNPENITSKLASLEQITDKTIFDNLKNNNSQLVREFNSYSDFTKYVKDSKATLEKLADYGIEEGLDEALFDDIAFAKGFFSGQRTKVDAMKDNLAEQNWNKAHLAGLVGEYEVATKFIDENIDLVGSSVVDRLFIPGLGQSKTAITDFINNISSGTVDGERIMANIDQKHPDISSHIRAIIGEETKRRTGIQVGSGYDATINAVSDFYEIHTEKKIAFEKLVEIMADPKGDYKMDLSSDPEERIKEVVQFANSNSKLPSAAKYIDLHNKSNQFAQMGISLRNLGSGDVGAGFEIAQKAFNAINSKRDIHDAMFDQVYNLNLGDIWSEMPSDAKLSDVDRELELLKNYTIATGTQGNNASATQNLIAEGTNVDELYTSNFDTLKNTMLSSQSDEKADIIAEYAGIASWDNYNSPAEFIEAGRQQIQSQYGSDEATLKKALQIFSNLVNSLTKSDLPALSLETMNEQGSSGIDISQAMGMSGAADAAIGMNIANFFGFGPEDAMEDPLSAQMYGGLESMYTAKENIETALNRIDLLGLTRQGGGSYDNLQALLSEIQYTQNQRK
tara:strand:- start:342 stop:2597 length:2256 start_codon:yes stop_codon:yes gene_type:complete